MIDEIVERHLNEGIFSKDPVGEGDKVVIKKTNNPELKKYIGKTATVTWQNIKGLAVDIVFPDGTEIEKVSQKDIKKVKASPYRKDDMKRGKTNQKKSGKDYFRT